MDSLAGLYKEPLALLTDLYQVTMAYGYWRRGMHERQVVFTLSYRSQPFNGGYSVLAGIEPALDYLERYRFEEDDLAYLAALRGSDGQPLFEEAFVRYLGDMRLSLNVDAAPEGTFVFPHEPLMRVSGPLLQCQLVETPLLNHINFQTLIATKSARICRAAKGEPVLEFGLRRAQGIDGGVSASRAAYIGGCAGTSNLLAGKLYNIPVRGTHAHSFVMSFDNEIEAFDAFADAMPNNCIFLVDTYDTLQGVRNAVKAGKRLRERGHELLGVRLDSGDLAYLSIEARKILDQGGFPNAKIVASNDLDEHIIESLKEQGATIAVWGVGTRLATAYDQPAFGGVYKLSAIMNDRGEWVHTLKLSEQQAKISTPGILQTRRYFYDGEAIGDLIFDLSQSPDVNAEIVDPLDMTRRKLLPSDATWSDLLIRQLDKGIRARPKETLDDIRQRVAAQFDHFHAGVLRLVNPHQYPVGLENALYARKQRLVFEQRERLRRLPEDEAAK
jgi:nicotinate phosphoribosyltransferase